MSAAIGGAGGLRSLLRRVPTFEPDADRARMERVSVLDGLRGWAALAVVSFHLFWETFGHVDPIYRNVFTASLVDGPLAVSIFFVLSGEALSVSYFAGGGPRAVVVLAIRRYPRLVLPVLAVSALTAVLVASGLSYNVAAGTIVGRPEWLGEWLRTPVSVGRVFRFAFYEVFTKIGSDISLIPLLWSMRLELIGSFTTFTLLLVCHRMRVGWIVVGLTFCSMMVAYSFGVQTLGNLACFVAGIGFAKMRASGVFDRAQHVRYSAPVTTLLIAGLLAFDAATMTGLYHGRHPCTIAIVLTMAMYCNLHVSRFLSNRISQFLGAISFPLFLVQFPVLISFTSWVVIITHDRHLPISSAVICLVSLAVMVLLAIALMPVETLTRRLGRWATGRLVVPPDPETCSRSYAAR